MPKGLPLRGFSPCAAKYVKQYGNFSGQSAGPAFTGFCVNIFPMLATPYGKEQVHVVRHD